MRVSKKSQSSFLANNKIISFSSVGFENVTELGGGFLTNNKLPSFSAKGFENVQKIGADFLYGNEPLKYVDLTAFQKLNSVEGGFLGECPNIKGIFVSKNKEQFFKGVIPHSLHKFIIVKP